MCLTLYRAWLCIYKHASRWCVQSCCVSIRQSVNSCGSIYKCMYVCMYGVCVYVQIIQCVCVYVYTKVCAYATHTHTYVVYVYTYMHSYIHTYIHTHTYIIVYTHIHTYIHTYVYVCVCVIQLLTGHHTPLIHWLYQSKLYRQTQNRLKPVRRILWWKEHNDVRHHYALKNDVNMRYFSFQHVRACSFLPLFLHAK